MSAWWSHCTCWTTHLLHLPVFFRITFWFEVSFRSSAKRYNDDLWWQDQRGELRLFEYIDTMGTLGRRLQHPCQAWKTPSWDSSGCFFGWLSTKTLQLVSFLGSKIKTDGNSHKLTLWKKYVGFHPLEGFLRCRILGVVWTKFDLSSKTPGKMFFCIFVMALIVVATCYIMFCRHVLWLKE